MNLQGITILFGVLALAGCQSDVSPAGPGESAVPGPAANFSNGPEVKR